MSSVLPGYEYDIFISYRQKDNKYDGWITDFVEHLRAELESTAIDEILLSLILITWKQGVTYSVTK